MHEMSLARSVAEIAEETAYENGSEKVTSVTLSVGKLSGIDITCLKQSLAAAFECPVLSGAKIEIKQPEGSAWCMDCSETVPLHRPGDACPKCGGHRLTINGGNGFDVAFIAISVPTQI